MAIELPTEGNMTGMFDLVTYVQDVSGGVFFPAMLLGIWIILFVGFKSAFTNAKAFAGTSFIVMVFAIILATLGFLSSNYMYITILITAISGVAVYLENARE